MAQLSFYSAEARAPRVADLAGLLCGPGQAVSFGRGTAARVSVVLDDDWRARMLTAACAERDILAERCRTDDGQPLVRTAFRADLTGLAARWLRGAVKAVPVDFALDGHALRMWAMTCGYGHSGGYSLALDRHAPGTHEPLVNALAAAGLPARLVGSRAGEPALRVTGRRRLTRLAELVGPVPIGARAYDWPVTC